MQLCKHWSLLARQISRINRKRRSSGADFIKINNFTPQYTSLARMSEKCKMQISTRQHLFLKIPSARKGQHVGNAKGHNNDCLPVYFDWLRNGVFFGVHTAARNPHDNQNGAEKSD